MDVADTSPLLNHYPAGSKEYDEMFAGGHPRPAYAKLLEQLNQLGQGEIQRRWQQAQQHLQDLGVTYNPMDDTGQDSRPWEFNPIPLVIQQREWQTLEAKLRQRAKLMQLILDDLLWDQRLIRERIVPPDLLFGHPRFQPSYLSLPRSVRADLLTCAVDLSRSSDGHWYATGDRCRSPNGLGYVLENRVVSSRMLPRMFEQNHVIRLARFFAAMMDRLTRWAIDGRRNPNIVLLTEGITSPNYFEDAYLARYLNCTLVEGADLTIRGNTVMLKTLGGLMPVDVIVRRIADDMCDAVELNPGSTIGVAGLVDSMRAGHVAVVNPIGAELVEAPAWLPFLPSVCQHLMGEELQLPSIDTWWCGQPAALDHVLTHLDNLIIRPAFQASGARAIFPEDLSQAEKKQLTDRIRHSPHLFVGQEPRTRSTVPVWCESHLEAWYMTLRCFMVAEQDSFRVLPGGLSRASKDLQPLVNRIRAGQRSQDVWILGDSPPEVFSLLPASEKDIQLRRGGSELPSRVADHLFWYGRNLERIDNSARIIRALLTRVAGDEDLDEESFRCLVMMLIDRGQIEPAMLDLPRAEALQQIALELPHWIVDEQNSSSLRSAIRRLVTGAMSVRDRLSMDAWQILAELDDNCRELASQPTLEIADALATLQHLIQDCAALAGLASDRMTRSIGWRFFDFGKRLEAALQITSMFRTYGSWETAEHPRAYATLLEVADCLMTYRSRYRSELHFVPIVDLLVLDESNPRSIAFQLRRISDHVQKLNEGSGTVIRTDEEKIAISLLSTILTTDPYQVCELDSDGARPGLEKLLFRLLSQLPRLSDVVSGRFLVHSGPPRHFGNRVGPMR